MSDWVYRPPELPCPICGKLFHNSQYLMRHANSAHGNQKRFKCEICGKGFENKDTFEGHMNWHLNLKPYKVKLHARCCKIFFFTKTAAGLILIEILGSIIPAVFTPYISLVQ